MLDTPEVSQDEGTPEAFTRLEITHPQAAEMLAEAQAKLVAARNQITNATMQLVFDKSLVASHNHGRTVEQTHQDPPEEPLFPPEPVKKK